MRENDVKFGDFVEGPGTYSTMCVASDHEKSDSHHSVIKRKSQTSSGIGGKWDHH